MKMAGVRRAMAVQTDLADPAGSCAGIAQSQKNFARIGVLVNKKASKATSRRPAMRDDSPLDGA
jgi:hypothetical protein